ncbi:ABC transporter ATP-binding protein [bacterium]|nr:ABC transporter ATP-binding protein [bacterium]
MTEEYDILHVKNLKVDFSTYGGTVQAVRNISFGINKGECLALVGESGCGKSVSAHSILRIVPEPPGQVSGEILFKGNDLTQLSEKQMLKIRGAEISMIFQDPMTYLNPTMRIGTQVTEIFKEHAPKRISGTELKRLCIDAFDMVGITDPEQRFRQYPYEFSGGMRQRALIAMALINKPSLIIADEPTTALDVTIQSQMLELMKTLQRETKTALILITHDLGVVAKMAHRVAIIYAGKIVETAPATDIYRNPRHPYTIGLLNSIPSVSKSSKEPLYSIKGTPPDLFNPPKGCGFAPRCEFAMDICDNYPPPDFQIDEGHHSACWLLHHQAPTNNLKTSVLSREGINP